MRAALPFLLLAPALLLAPDAPEAEARPPFARREQKACGYCHINPRGGGARNQTGLLYARNEFSFPPRKGNLNTFTRVKDRAAMVRARKLIDIDHTRAAVKQLAKLGRAVRKDPGLHKLVADEILGLDVRGTEILGQARRMLRGREDERKEAIELLVMLTAEYKELEVARDAAGDLRELKRQKELRDLIKREQTEAKARLLYLDGKMHQVDGHEAKARRAFVRVVAAFPETRAAKDVYELLHKKDGKGEQAGKSEKGGTSGDGGKDGKSGKKG
ncbi:MAG: hypothetical protein ACYTG3_07410 [Planctomycetota bacterium]|jgi:hypothetical protein